MNNKWVKMNPFRAINGPQFNYFNDKIMYFLYFKVLP